MYASNDMHASSGDLDAMLATNKGLTQQKLLRMGIHRSFILSCRLHLADLHSGTQVYLSTHLVAHLDYCKHCDSTMHS
jgi:hypothetical protein